MPNLARDGQKECTERFLIIGVNPRCLNSSADLKNKLASEMA
jgi:hypothetical protein